jgi:hypothetical protein
MNKIYELDQNIQGVLKMLVISENSLNARSTQFSEILLSVPSSLDLIRLKLDLPRRSVTVTKSAIKYHLPRWNTNP